MSDRTRLEVERDLAEALANLTATQERCSELLTENRAMRAAALAFVLREEWEIAVENERRLLTGAKR